LDAIEFNDDVELMLCNGTFDELPVPEPAGEDDVDLEEENDWGL